MLKKQQQKKNTKKISVQRCFLGEEQYHGHWTLPSIQMMKEKQKHNRMWS